MKSEIQIGRHRVGDGQSPFMVAEMSGNHNGDLDRARAIIQAAKDAGADAIKLQTYTPDTLTIDSDRADFRIKGGLWDGRTLYELYGEASTPWEWHKALFDFARDIGIIAFSSPFDTTAIDFLETLDCPAYKIASFEANDPSLIAHAARTGKPIIISTGLADQAEMEESLAAAGSAGCDQLIMLHCVSGYPTPPSEANLKTLLDMKTRLAVPIGLSDHTPSSAVAVSAVALGAVMVEKHLTLRRADGGPDAAFSLEPDEFAQMAEACRTAWEALGQVDYALTESERKSMIFRRSLYVVRDVQKGERFTHENVRSIRPGYGLAPKYLERIIGSRATCAIARGTPLGLSHIEEMP